MGTDWWSTNLLHGSLEVLDIGGWVGIGGRRMEELTGQAERVVPYTSSAVVQWTSSLRVVRMPRRTMGRESIQLVGLGCDLSEALR